MTADMTSLRIWEVRNSNLFGRAIDPRFGARAERDAVALLA
jgi:hypothetical protein